MNARKQRLLVAAVLSGLLLAMLDQTIVGTALPEIVRDLGGADLYIWLVTAYLVPATVSVPVYARLSDRHGRRALLLTGMALFLAGSVLAGLATIGIVQFFVQGYLAPSQVGISFVTVRDALVVVPILIGVGAPSSLAVSLAGDRGMTLCGFARRGRINVYTHPARIS